MENNEFLVFSPGRVNIIGEHIDYNGGLVLPMAINRGTCAKVKINNSNKINMYSINFENEGIISFDYNNITKDNNWVDYVKGVFVTLEKHGYINKYGMDIEIYGNIPNGSGLSSSASLEVLMGQVLNKINKFDISDEQMAVYCMEAENNFVGVNCGIMDQFIIANAEKNKVMKLDCSTHSYENVFLELENHSILIANSNKKRELVDSKYNERRAQCEEALKIIQNHYDVKNICEINFNQLESIKSDFSELIYKRAKHVVTENMRVNEITKTLNNNDLKRSFDILNEAHISISKDYEVSCDELDYICEEALKNGADAARMTGAGFGGCCIIIIENSKINALTSNLKNLYMNKFNLNLDVYVAKSESKAKVYNGVI